MKGKFNFWQLTLLFAVLPSITQAQGGNKNGEDSYEIAVEYDPTGAVTSVLNVSNFKGSYSVYNTLTYLQWSVSGGANSFIVEYSTDNKTFKPIGEKKGSSGFENGEFEFTTTHFQQPCSYYRLKTVTGSQVALSNPISVCISTGDNLCEISVVDDGNKKKITIRSLADQRLLMEFKNTQGKVVKELLDVDAMVNEIITRTIERDAYAPGDYQIVLFNEKFMRTIAIKLP
jgi:hypothetical protein